MKLAKLIAITGATAALAGSALAGGPAATAPKILFVMDDRTERVAGPNISTKRINGVTVISGPTTLAGATPISDFETSAAPTQPNAEKILYVRFPARRLRTQGFYAGNGRRSRPFTQGFYAGN